MKISSVRISNFKRFRELTISDIPPEAKLVVIVGPNGSGKSSLFEAFYTWYRTHGGPGMGADSLYYPKDATSTFDYSGAVSVSFHGGAPTTVRKAMYFRTAYRNDPDFTINTFSNLGEPGEHLRVNRLIDNDQSVSQNYQRLIHQTLQGVYDEQNDGKTVKALRDELVGQVRTSMRNVFEDLVLNSIGDPLSSGTFYFEKGTSKSFHYKNLSGGEKSAFDLLLDLILKLRYYNDTVYFIDEPEAHMHTRLQGRLLGELFNLIPENGQLWISTHSLGIMRKAKELSDQHGSKVAFLDFEGQDFDEICSVGPSSIGRIVWEKFLSVALDDLGTVAVPQWVFLCEGSKTGRKNLNFDSEVYSRIFHDNDAFFVSAGSCTEIEKDDNVALLVLRGVFKNKTVSRVVDRDDRSQTEVGDLAKRGITVLKRRHIESYLLDDEIVTKLAGAHNPALVADALQIKAQAIQASTGRGNPPDDIKSAAGEIFVGLKKLLGLTQCGNTHDSFLRDTMAPLVTDDTSVFKDLRLELFGN